MFSISRRLCSAIPPPSRNVFRMKYSTSRLLQQFDAPPVGEDRDDDEFIFPVQFSFPHVEHQWLWSGADISRELDLGADAFLPKKEVIYSTETIKILKVQHKEHGSVLFTLVQDETELWKICNLAVFGDTERLTSAAISSKQVDTALGSMLDILNDKEMKLWKSSPALDVFAHPYQYVCPPFAIKMTDSIGKLIKLAEGDRETYLPSCFKLPVRDSDEHCQKSSGESTINVKQNTLIQSDNLALVAVDVFAYDRVGMIDAVFEMLVLLEQGEVRAGPGDQGEERKRNILSFTSDGRANTTKPGSDESCAGHVGGERCIRISSLMISNERRKKAEKTA